LDATPAIPVFPFRLGTFELWLPQPAIWHPKKAAIMWKPCLLSVLVLAGGARFVAAQSQPTPNSAAQTSAERENHDPLLDPPPLPKGEVTLIGGTITSLDEVMNRMVVQPFGSKQKLRVAFDTRTHFYRDRKPISYREIRQGQRIYLDSMLNGSKVFAKTIWIQSTSESGIGRGQILDYDSAGKLLTVRDEISSQPVKMQLTPTTVIEENNRRESPQALVRGALVSLSFGPQRELRNVTLLARPGSTFTFAGRVTYLDVSQKIIAVDNCSDRRKYDISIAAIAPNLIRQLREGSEINVSTVFDGEHYDARRIDLLDPNPASQP
jgi:hypothetical protein